MSRAQQGSIESIETGNSATDRADSKESQKAQQYDIETQQSQLAKYAASNPYVQGGAAQTATNQQLTGIADATANAAKEQNQNQAKRTGQNATAGVAAGEAEQQAAQRTLGTQSAGALQSRLAAETQYNQGALNAQNQITSQQNALGDQEVNQAQGEESIAANEAAAPSFADRLGAMVTPSLCWIAAELYGGWDDPRVITFRAWLLGPLQKIWLGRRFVDLYRYYGERVAAIIHFNRPLRFVVKLVFDRLLSAAQKNKGVGRDDTP